MENKGLDFKHKEVININNGKRLGFVQDVCADLETGAITSIIVPGEKKFANIFTDKNNVVILLDDHNVIIRSESKVDLVDIELNEFLCSYRKTLNDDKLKIIICEYSKEYDY